MRLMKVHGFALVLVSGVVLSACSGGGAERNAAPVVSNVALQTTEDTAGTISVTATDADGDQLTASVSSPPAKGTVNITGSGPFAFTYTPAPDTNGSDVFDFQVSDGRGGIAHGQVSVAVTPAPDAPVIRTRQYTTYEDSTLNDRIDAYDPDGDPVTVLLTGPAANGVVQIGDAATGQFTYQPHLNYNGSDSFAVQVQDGSSSAAATIDLVVTSRNDPPVAVADDVVLPTNVTSLINVLANDSDVEGDALQVDLLVLPRGATATVVGTQISVTPDAGVAGPTSLEYRVADASGDGGTARVQIVFGSAQPLFYATQDPSSGERQIRRYAYFSSTVLNTPVPAGERLGDFITSADASRMVYITTVPGLPVWTRLWLKDLTDESAPVQELDTGGNFFARSLAISTDGNHIAFNNRYAYATRPDQAFTFGGDAERPRFSRDGQHLFYVTLLPGGGRTIHRAQIDPLSGPTMPVQITASYGVAEGLGIDYTLTHNEAHVVSAGLFLTPPFAVKQAAYVSPVNGPVNDQRLHPPLTTVTDFAQQPAVTRDDRYAYYLATLGGVSGIYATDLQLPGTAIRMDVNPTNEYASNPRATADSSTLFYTLSTGSATRWFYTTFAQPSVATPFAPGGSSLPPVSTLSLAPDGSAVVFTVGTYVFATTAPYTSAEQLLPGDWSSTAEVKYAPDANTVAVRRSEDPSRVLILNPKIPGWVGEATSSSSALTVSCFVFPGERCYQ